MKLIAKIFLTILFVPLFLILVLGITLKFQILKPAFWENAFKSKNTYSNLSAVVSKSLRSQVIAEGGREGDVKILTDLISPDNLKDVINKNIFNILEFANGKVTEMVIYVPVNKIPKSLLPKSLGKITEQMSLTDLLQEFNVQGVDATQIQMFHSTGLMVSVFLVITTFLLSLLLFLLYVLTNPEKRLIAHGVSFIISGVIISIITALGTVIRINWTKDLAGSSNLGNALIGVITPPIMEGVIGLWQTLAIISIISGIVLLFLKKPLGRKK
jgi:hypothetical protein